jgi:hypothetical protein
MDQIFDRLGNLLKSFVRDDSNGFSDTQKTASGDPDLQDAWDELDDFLKNGDDAPPSQGPTPGAGTRTSNAPRTPSELTKDYKILEAPFGAPLSLVAKSYKRLLRLHHPDRHATDPAASAKATERTKLLTSSFRRIRQYEETGTVS